MKVAHFFQAMQSQSSLVYEENEKLHTFVNDIMNPHDS